MRKEIHEQPDALVNAMRGRLNVSDATAKLSGMQLAPADLAQWFQDEARELAARFNQRNGNNAYSLRMDEDRDLDPIREHRRSGYDALVKIIKIKYDLEDD